ncbi:diacylglycerol/lipid kinase family protein [Longibacter sp.]|uniref:diacylglycerol/lipid kinase family protein n=1 Tax=Longibacter sp. TaxID=2045415 RepID=UPI003EBB0DAE
MSPTTHVIANPAAGSRHVQRRSRRIAARLSQGPAAALISWTQGPGHATRLTRRALRQGIRQIIVLGGDGTLNEVVNGFFDADEPIAPDASLLPLGGGTGSDFLRTLRELPDRPTGNAGTDVHPVDLMRVSYTNVHGDVRTRYAINIASMGLGGLVVRRVQSVEQRRFIGGTVAYFAAIIRCLQDYEHDDVRVIADGTDTGVHRVRNIAVANARYFGGGLQIAPHAVVDDGVLDVVLLDNVPFRRLLRDARRIYAGEHTGLPYIRPLRARSLTIVPTGTNPVFLEMDGDPVGQLPATFQVIPDAVNIHLPCSTLS